MGHGRRLTDPVDSHVVDPAIYYPSVTERTGMTGADRFTVFGVYVTDAVADALEDHLYEEAGVLDLEGYFAETPDSVPAGDPGAEVTDALVADAIEGFPTLYDEADFTAVEGVGHDGYDLVRLAAKPARAAELRDRFQAAATVRDVDLRTVQTAILAAALSVEPTAD